MKRNVDKFISRTFFKRRKSNNYEAFPTNFIARISDGMALEGCFHFI
jgi:hypothetical protein